MKCSFSRLAHVTMAISIAFVSVSVAPVAKAQSTNCADQAISSAVGETAMTNVARVINDNGGNAAYSCRLICTASTPNSCVTGGGCSGTNVFCCPTNQGVDPAGQCQAANSNTNAPATNGAATNQGSPVTLSNPLGTTSLPVIFGRIARAFIGILGAVALLMYIIGGILWMTAADSKRVETGKGMIVNASIGILIVFFSYFIALAFLAFFTPGS